MPQKKQASTFLKAKLEGERVCLEAISLRNAGIHQLLSVDVEMRRQFFSQFDRYFSRLGKRHGFLVAIEVAGGLMFLVESEAGRIRFLIDFLRLFLKLNGLVEIA